MLNGLDLFSGIGGISIALSEWVRPVAYCENDKYAQAVLLSRMSTAELASAPIWDDIRTLTGLHLPDIDIIYGGFPCQDISVAGPNHGLEGKRSGLFFEMLRLVDDITPKFVFLENVPAIRTRGAERVCKELAARGYDCRWESFSAEEIGAPHRRKRWFLLAANADGCDLWNKSRWTGWTYGPSSAESRTDSTALESNAVRFRRREGRPWSEVWRRLSDAFFDGNKPWPKEIPEPAVCGVPNGIPGRVDRLRALGNAVVPSQAREAFKRLVGIK